MLYFPEFHILFLTRPRFVGKIKVGKMLQNVFGRAGLLETLFFDGFSNGLSFVVDLFVNSRG